MTASNQIQYQVAAVFTATTTLADIPIPPGSFVTALLRATSVSGTSPSLTANLRGRTIDGNLISLISATAFTSATSRQIQYENAPATIFIDLSISGTTPSFTFEIDLIITPPAAYAA